MQDQFEGLLNLYTAASSTKSMVHSKQQDDDHGLSPPSVAPRSHQHVMLQHNTTSRNYHRQTANIFENQIQSDTDRLNHVYCQTMIPKPEFCQQQ